MAPTTPTKPSKTASDDETKEYFESAEELDRKVRILADWVRQAKHSVVYTGAGLSTSAGIPDFRGPNGVWTMRDKGQKVPRVPSHMTMPTLGHMAIVSLVNSGLLKYVVSQNTDGLHIRSGIPVDKLAELHGNTNKDYCPQCGRVYTREYRTRKTGNKVYDHKTGRFCESDGKELLDTIINFGENLPEDHLENAEKHSKQADLGIILGSSMKVTPACDLPPMVKSKPGGKLVIVNLQKTPLDNQVDLVIHAKTDEVLCKLVDLLGLTIPPYVYTKDIAVISERVGSDSNQVSLGSIGRDTVLFVALSEARLVSNKGDKIAILNQENEWKSGKIARSKIPSNIEFMFRVAPPRASKQAQATGFNRQVVPVSLPEASNPNAVIKKLVHFSYNLDTGEWTQESLPDSSTLA